MPQMCAPLLEDQGSSSGQHANNDGVIPFTCSSPFLPERSSAIVFAPISKRVYGPANVQPAALNLLATAAAPSPRFSSRCSVERVKISVVMAISEYWALVKP